MAFDKYLQRANEASDGDLLYWNIQLAVGASPFKVDMGAENPSQNQVVKAMVKKALGLDIDIEKGRILIGAPSYKMKGTEAVIKPGSSLHLYFNDGIKVEDWSPLFDRVLNQELTNGIENVLIGDNWLSCGSAWVFAVARLAFKKERA